MLGKKYLLFFKTYKLNIIILITEILECSAVKLNCRFTVRCFDNFAMR